MDKKCKRINITASSTPSLSLLNKILGKGDYPISNQQARKITSSIGIELHQFQSDRLDCQRIVDHLGNDAHNLKPIIATPLVDGYFSAVVFRELVFSHKEYAVPWMLSSNSIEFPPESIVLSGGVIFGAPLNTGVDPRGWFRIWLDESSQQHIRISFIAPHEHGKQFFSEDII